MSFKPDLIQYPYTENIDALSAELFFAPAPQHPDAPPPDLFDQDVAGLDLDLPFQQFDDFLPAFYESIPNISTPPALTYSTDSHYSSDFTQSEYSIPSEIESYFSSDNGLHGTHESIQAAASSDGPPSIPPLHPVEAQFDFGTSDLSSNVGISPEKLSDAMQPPPSVVPTPLPAHVTPASEAQAAPTPDRPFKCPFCLHSSKRSYNLKTHIRTHNKIKPFKCTICGSRFTRKNDLDRHRGNPSVHRNMKAKSLRSQSRPPSSHYHKWRSEADDVSLPDLSCNSVLQLKP